MEIAPLLLRLQEMDSMDEGKGRAGFFLNLMEVSYPLSISLYTTANIGAGNIAVFMNYHFPSKVYHQI